ncbi:MAG: amino acid permease [Lachnospiraceae bacterium]|nr:amino acid permease [Lachnospiraceae bacterium]
MEAPEKNKLKPYLNPMGTWAFSIGTSIGWGSFVVTCSTYLAQAGFMGTILGLVLGMIVIFIITKNLSYAIEKVPDAGGLYSYVQKACGHDHGFLIAWFLLLTYMAVLWANITSLPLFARRFMGGIFSVGYCYTVFGYEVYLGEVLLSVFALLLVAFLCSRSTRIPQVIMIVMALCFVLFTVFCTVISLFRHDTGFVYDTAFLPGRSEVLQVIHVAVISPWAFIGFENIAHFTEEIKYPVRKIRRVLTGSVLVTTAVYILMTLLSVSAYPSRFSGWLEYIRNMDSLSGIESVPAFYAAEYYLGDLGVDMMLLALLSVIVTSIIGNLTALSRLIYALGRDGIAPAKLGEVNSHNIPAKAILCVAVFSCLIPLLGRTAIGWIVDVTTLGSTIIYGVLSYAVFRDAQKKGDKIERSTGAAGAVLMIGFVVLLLAPKLLAYEAMPSESYLLFASWSLLGLIVFRMVMGRDGNRVYGRSVIVWMLLLLLMLLTTMMWVSRETQTVTDNSMREIREFYEEQTRDGRVPDAAVVDAFLTERAERIESVDSRNTFFSYGLFIVAVLIMINNFRISRSREQEWEKELGVALRESSTDPLTGVKNKHAFFIWTERIDKQIENEDRAPFAIAVCDINDLKWVNDTLGHKTGDERIRQACMLICRVFSHSPVFRYGGDEFVVILEGADYESRHELIARIDEYSAKADREKENPVAAGIAEFDPKRHGSLINVFEEADGVMYERKKLMKQQKQGK